MSSTIRNRWSVVIGAILIQLALGSLYAWSVFTPSLTADPYNLTRTQTQIIFSVGLAVFAIVMIFAGRVQSKYHPRNVAMTGGLILGLGFILAKFVGTSFTGLLLTLGVVVGVGIGIAYVIPIAVGVKWFPDKKGLVSGLAVAGFGFGATFWVKLADSWLGLIAKYGVANVFLIYGVVFAILTVVGSLFLANPPEGYKPAGWTPPAAASPSSGAVQFHSAKMLRTPQFYSLWFVFLAGAMAGLMVIGVIKLFGIDALKSTGMDPAQASITAGTAMGVFYALANGLGRIGWGLISDKIGRKLSLGLNIVIQGAIMLLFYKMAFQVGLFYLGATIIGFNFGGLFALFPSLTADYFGNKTVGLNYGWVFSAYGVAGVIGPTLAGKFGEAAKVSGDLTVWSTPFMIAGLTCLAAGVLCFSLCSPKAPKD